MSRRFLGLAVTLALALGACGSSGLGSSNEAAAGAQGGAGSSGGPGASGGAGSATPGRGAPSMTPGAAGSQTPNPYATFKRPTGPTPPPGYYDLFFDVVNVSVPEDESWGGADCAPPRAGSHCTILFRGVAYLARDDTGTLLIQLIEDDRPVPKTLFRMSVRKGRSTIYEWAPYKVPAGVRTVLTKAVLQNSKGVPVAESPPQRFYIS